MVCVYNKLSQYLYICTEPLEAFRLSQLLYQLVTDCTASMRSLLVRIFAPTYTFAVQLNRIQTAVVCFLPWGRFLWTHTAVDPVLEIP